MSHFMEFGKPVSRYQIFAEIKIVFSMQHIHVVLGPIVITTEQDSETMATGSFASLHSGEFCVFCFFLLSYKLIAKSEAKNNCFSVRFA